MRRRTIVLTKMKNFISGLFGRNPSPAERGFASAAGAFALTLNQDGLLVDGHKPLTELIPGAKRGKPLSAAFLPEDRARIEAALTENAPARLRAHARLADGSVGAFDLHIEITAYGAGVLLVDRTEDKKAHEQIVRAAEKARADARASASVLADLSHEMKTPLNAVIGFADSMKSETFGPIGNERYAEYADYIHSSGEHLLDLVVSILDLARIEADRLTLSPVLSDPAALAHECVAMIRQQAENSGLELVVDVPGDIPECMIDPRAIRQILVNLLSNAVKFTSDGEVRLSLRVAQEAGNPQLVFVVKDTGIGMGREELARLGPRFTDVQGAGVRGAEGAGLGLSLAFKLAEMHGGVMQLDSAPGEGLMARVTLPLTSPERKETARKELARNLRADAPAITGTKRPMRPMPVASAADTAITDGAAENAPLTQLERIEAYRRETGKKRHDAA